MRQRPFVEKFESGEYLHEWNGFSPFDLGAVAYSEVINDTSAEKYFHCVGEFNGIGDVSWWIKEEIDKLDSDQLTELRYICEYNQYIRKFVSVELVSKLANFYNCSPFHIYRTGNNEILNLCNYLDLFYDKIVDGSRGCLDPKTIEFKSQPNLFKLLTFDEFKQIEI